MLDIDLPFNFIEVSHHLLVSKLETLTSDFFVSIVMDLHYLNIFGGTVEQKQIGKKSYSGILIITSALSFRYC